MVSRLLRCATAIALTTARAIAKPGMLFGGPVTASFQLASILRGPDAGTAAHVLYHPVDRALWLVTAAQSGALELWAFRDGAFARLCGIADDPWGGARWPRALLFHPARGPILLASATEAGPLRLCALGPGGAGEWLSEPNSPMVTPADVFVIDERRGALVCLSPNGIFELDAADSRPCAAALPPDWQFPIIAGWDLARDQIIAVAASGLTIGWDGERLTDYPPAPAELTLGFPEVSATRDPLSGHLVLLPRHRYFFDDALRPFVLEERGWQPLGWSLPGQWAAQCYDAERDLVCLFAAAAGVGAARYAWAFWDGHALRYQEPALIAPRQVVLGKDGALIVGQTPGELALLTGGALIPVAPGVAGRYVPSPLGPLAVAADGEVGLLQRSRVVGIERATPFDPKGVVDFDGERQWVAAWDPVSSCLFVSEGNNPGPTGHARATWVWNDDGWHRVPCHAEPNLDGNSRMVWTGGKSPLLVLSEASAKPGAIATSVLKGSTWHTHSLRLVGGARLPRGASLRCLALDPPSGLTVAYFSSGQLWAWCDHGDWVEIAVVAAAPGANFAVDYDPVGRQLVGVGRAGAEDGASGLAHVVAALGPLLDDLPAKARAAVHRATEIPEWQPCARALARTVEIDGGAGRWYWRGWQYGDRSWDITWNSDPWSPAALTNDGDSDDWVTINAAKEKRYDNPTHARRSFHQKVQEHLLAGYVDEAPDCEVVPLRPVYAVVPIPGPHGQKFPPQRCRGCGRPLEFVIAMDVPSLSRYSGVAVFMCDMLGPILHDSSGPRTFEPNDGANAAVLLGRNAARQASSAASVLRYERKEQHSRARRFRLGGETDWVQSPEGVICDTCHAPMSVIADFEPPFSKCNFGDSGRGYVLVCPYEHQAKFLWQCC